jgi:hypothetical protein
MKTTSLPASFHSPCYRIVSYHTKVWIRFAHTHYHAQSYIHAYMCVCVHTHTHIWCNSIEFGFQTFEDVYTSHTHKSLKTCALHVCISIQHTSVSIEVWQLAGCPRKSNSIPGVNDRWISYTTTSTAAPGPSQPSIQWYQVPGGRAVGRVSYLSPLWMTMFEICGSKPPLLTCPRGVHET